MSREYTEDKEVTLTKLSSGRRLLEALLILIVLFAVWLMAALLSFNPSDPSWSQTARHEPIHNLGGMPGAWLADTLFFIFGVMAYTIPVIIVGGCWFAGVISPVTNTLIILPFRYASLAFWRSSLPPVVWRQSTLTISGILPPVASLAAY